MDAVAVWFRYVCVLLHVFALAVALGTIFREDFKLLIEKNPHLDLRHLHRISRVILCALAVLWVTGLTLISIDTGWAPEKLANPKLLTKLIVVVVLTINGVVLHRILMPSLSSPSSHSPRVATIFSLVGAISMVSWLYAACLGVAKPLVPLMGFASFFGLYLLAVGGAIGIALTYMRPRIERLLATERPPAAIHEDTYVDFPLSGEMQNLEPQ